MMDSITNHIRSHLLERLGLFKVEKVPSLNTLYETEWSNEFERKMMRYIGDIWCSPFIKLMHNRLIMGRFRYGALKVKKNQKFDRVDSIKKRIALYEEIGNAEILVDIANIALVEYVEENHPLFHFSTQDDSFHDKRR